MISLLNIRPIIFLLSTDTRETAFANAITSAGAAYTLTQACSMGDLLQCGCADKPIDELPPPVVTNSVPGSAPDGAWEWGGCGDDIEYGYSKSKEFMDINERRPSDINALVTLHNNEAGRLVSISQSLVCPRSAKIFAKKSIFLKRKTQTFI